MFTAALIAGPSMSTDSAVPPEAYEAATIDQILAEHEAEWTDHHDFVDGTVRRTWRCRCGAEGATNMLPHFLAVALASGVAEGRRQAAEAIRERADDIAARAEALAGFPPGAADDHPVTMGFELAARIAEGNTDA